MQMLKKNNSNKNLIVNDTGMREEHFDCICDSNEHSLRVTYFVDEWDGIEEDEVYLSLFLSDRPLWGRIWQAIKYVFGYKCIYGHFQCITIKREDAERFRNLMDRYIQSGLIDANKERNVRIVEQGRDYVILENGTKVNLLIRGK